MRIKSGFQLTISRHIHRTSLFLLRRAISRTRFCRQKQLCSMLASWQVEVLKYTQTRIRIYEKTWAIYTVASGKVSRPDDVESGSHSKLPLVLSQVMSTSGRRPPEQRSLRRRGGGRRPKRGLRGAVAGICRLGRPADYVLLLLLRYIVVHHEALDYPGITKSSMSLLLGGVPFELSSVRGFWPATGPWAVAV